MDSFMQKQLLEMLNKMDKKDLEQSISKVSNALSTEDKERILGFLNNSNKNK